MKQLNSQEQNVRRWLQELGGEETQGCRGYRLQPGRMRRHGRRLLSNTVPVANVDCTLKSSLREWISC